MAKLHRDIDTENTDKVQIVSIAGSENERFLHQRFRIGVSANHPMELCLGYHKAESDPKFSLKLKDSVYFSPCEIFTIGLKPGESFVEFKIPFEFSTITKDRIVVVVNGIVVHEAVRPTVQPLWKSVKARSHKKRFVSVLENENQFFEVEPVWLVTIKAWPDNNKERVSLILRPVEGHGQ